MPGAQCTRGRVCNKKAHALATTGTPLSTGIPCAMVLRLIRDLPGEPLLNAHIFVAGAAKD
jgi:hypothetical protein